MTLQGKGDDVTGGDVIKQGGDITGEKENDVTVGDVAGMAVWETRMSQVREIT